MANESSSDTEPGVVAWLVQWAQRQNLVQRAREGCAQWLQSPETDLPYPLPDVRIIFRSHALYFANARLSYPYVETRLDLLVDDQEIGYYRLITRLDGVMDDDYLVLH